MGKYPRTVEPVQKPQILVSDQGLLCLLTEISIQNAVKVKRPPETPETRGYKTLFMLNSAEREILNAHKYKYTKKFSFFQAQIKPRMLFFLLINVKMPIIVGILTFMSRKYFMLS